MIFAAILAGGIGARMGNPDKPKQFYMLGNKPVLVHTVEKFCSQGSFDRVIVLSPETWIQQTRDILTRYCAADMEKVDVVAGGAVRNDTVLCALEHIEKQYGIDSDTILVTHDAVRPFVSHRVIEDNISLLNEYDACDTVIPVTDTIVESIDKTTISSIPLRSLLYQGQTPQSFKAEKLKSLMFSLGEDEKEILTDACKIFVLREEKVGLVEGDVSNIKITYPHDMRVARAMLEDESC